MIELPNGSSPSLIVKDSSSAQDGVLKSTTAGSSTIWHYSTGSITVNSGTVTAIGDPIYSKGPSEVTVTGGTVRSTGSIYAIRTKGGNVTVSGGAVITDATGAAAIDNDGGTVTISGGALITTGSNSKAINSTGTITVSSGLILGDVTGTHNAALVWSCTGDMTLPINAQIPIQKIFTVKEGSTFTVPQGVTLTNNGSIHAYGTFHYGAPVYGTINGSSSIYNNSTSTLKVLKAGAETTSPTYGDTVTLRVEAKRKETSGFSLSRLFNPNKVMFYRAEENSPTKKEIGTADVTYDSNTQIATAELTITLKGDNWVVPYTDMSYDIYAEFGGSDAGKLLESEAKTTITMVCSGALQLTVSGECKFGETLRASVNESDTGTLYVNWTPLGGTVVTDQTEYELTESDIGKTITVTAPPPRPIAGWTMKQTPLPSTVPAAQFTSTA